jgi:hypothetical protein
MSKNSRRLLQAALAVAGTAVLCASFVGTAAAAPNATDEVSDAQDSVSNGTPGDAPEAPKAPDTKGLTGRGLLDNDVVSLESPKLKGISYTYSGFRAVPAHSPGDNEDEDNLCPGPNGEHKLPGKNSVFQNPCQTHGNHIGSSGHLNDIPFALPMSAKLPGDDDTGNITQHGDKPTPLTDPGAVAKQLGKGNTSLNKISDHHLAVTPV